MKTFGELLEAASQEVVSEAVDRATVRELFLYITNDSQIHKQRIAPIIKNLSKKVGKATYDGNKAIKAFGYAVVDGLKKYEKEHAEKGWAKSVDKKTREAIAEELLDYYSEQIGEAYSSSEG
jgi:predicted transcriptional regulator